MSTTSWGTDRLATRSPGATACSFGAALLVAALGLAACAAPASRNASAAHRQPLTALRREDAVWLKRASFGLNSEVVADYHALGRERYLEEQLQGPGEKVPAPIGAQIHTLEVSQPAPATTLQGLRDRRKGIDAMAGGADKEQARKSLNDEGNRLAAPGD